MEHSKELDMYRAKREDETEFQGSASQDNVTVETLPAALVEVQAASLADAIGKAQQALASELVSWALADVQGQFGGFMEVCEVRTVIYAKAGPL